MSEKASEKSEMSEVAWASDILQNVVAPPGSAGGKMERIREAAHRLRWSFSRTKDVWYADDRVAIKPREMRRIEEVSGVTYGRREIGEVDRLIARADAILADGSARLDRPFIAALRAFVGAADRPGAGGDSR